MSRRSNWCGCARGCATPSSRPTASGSCVATTSTRLCAPSSNSRAGSANRPTSITRSEHAEQLAAVASDEIESSEADWLSTHPYSPLSVKALDLFARSDAFHGIMGRSPAEARFHRFLGKSGVLLPKAELEREVDALMRMMNPSFLSDELDVAVATRELLALAGMAIALADGQVTRGEREALGSLVGKRGVVDSAADLLALSPEEHDARMASLAESLSSHLSPFGRKKLVEDLIVVALADRHLARAELDVAMKVAARLGVSPEDVERTVGRVLGQLD